MLKMVEVARDTALEQTSEERYEALQAGSYATISGVEVYRLNHPDHGDVLMLLPASGEAYILPIANQN